ncbi:tight junction-associated protein 1 isoform 3-T6 [Urocitellus parryii]
MTSAAPAKKPYRKAPPEHRELRLEIPGSRLEQEEPLTDAERMKLLQQENEELRRRLASATRRTEALERELEIGQDCLELELGQSREELDKFKDKFRRLQNSYTASQRTNQELEDKLHTLASLSHSWIFAIKKAEMDRKTLDWEIVELTNKLLDAKNTINKLEELNERYRLDCNLAVQLLKCNKSHFRNHKFADLPCELQDMVRKHMHSGQEAASPGPAPSLAPGAVVPTSVIARVLEKPESLLLNSAQSGSTGHPLAEDVFVHVDMSGGAPGDPASPPAPGSPTLQPNGECHSLGTTGGSPEEELPLPAIEKLSPYPTPSPPHPLDEVVPVPSSLPDESGLLLPTEPDSGFPREEEEEELNLPISPEEERQSLLPGGRGTEGPGTSHPEGRAWPLTSSSRPQRSPKRMGVHHLHRKDSLTQAQEQGTLLS